MPSAADVDARFGAIRVLVGAGAADVHGDGHAHAPARAGPRPLLAPPDGVPHRLEAFDQVRRVETPPRARHVARPVRVQNPEVDRVEPARVGQLVHLRLDREGDLRMPVPAELAPGVLVRVDERRADVHAATRAVPRRRGGDRRPRDRGAGVVVGAVVDQDPRLAVRQPSVPVDPRGQLHVEGVPALRGRELLGAAEDEPHGPAGADGERAGEHLLVGDLRLGAEPAAHGDLAHDDLAHVEIQDPGDLLAHEVGRLGGRPELEPARFRIPAGEGAVRLHARVRLPAEPVAPRDRGAGGAAAGLDVAVGALDHERDVGPRRAGVKSRGAVGQGRRDGGDRGQRLVAHADGAERGRRPAWPSRPRRRRPPRRRTARRRARAAGDPRGARLRACTADRASPRRRAPRRRQASARPPSCRATGSARAGGGSGGPGRPACRARTTSATYRLPPDVRASHSIERARRPIVIARRPPARRRPGAARSTIPAYPVHRQMFPDISRRSAPSSAGRPSRRSATPRTI